MTTPHKLDLAALATPSLPQLADADMDFLYENMTQMPSNTLKTVKVLNLSSNLLAAKGMLPLGQICDKFMLRNLHELDISFNKRLGVEGFAELRVAP